MTDQAPLTLREIHDKRSGISFIGRHEEVTLFSRNLQVSPDDASRKFVVNLSGDSGVGKSTLLNRFRNIALGLGAITAWVEDEEDTIGTPWVMGGICAQFRVAGVTLQNFESKFLEYCEKLKKLEAGVVQPGGLWNFAGTVIKAAIRAGRLNSKAKQGLDLIDEDTLADEAKQLFLRKVNKDDYDLINTPEEVLTPIFLSDILQLTREGPIALFFDAYERHRDILESWLIRILDGVYGDVAANLVIGIAGQTELDPVRWTKHEWMIERLPLLEFTDKEAREYLLQHGIVDAEVERTIITQSHRLPALLDAYVKSLAANPESEFDPAESIAARFFSGIEDESLRQLALDISLARKFDQDIAGLLQPGESPQSVFAQLNRLRFVHKLGDRWGYHEAIRSLLLRQRRDESRQRYHEVHEVLWAHYDGLVRLGEDYLEGMTGVFYPDRFRADCALEALYHRLCASPHSPELMSSCIRGFVRALDSSISYSRMWAKTMHQAGEDDKNQELLQLSERLLAALDALEEKRYQEAIDIFRLIQRAAKDDKTTSAQLFGICAYLWCEAGDLENALTQVDKGLGLAPDDYVLHTERGRILRLTGRYEEAENAIIKALDIAPKSMLARVQLLALTVKRGSLIYLSSEISSIGIDDADVADSIDQKSDRGLVLRALAYVQEALSEVVTTTVSMALLPFPPYLDHSDLINLIESALVVAPNNIRLLSARASVHFAFGYNVEAARDYEQTIALDPRNRIAEACNRGLALSRSGRYEEAIACYELDLADNPDHYRPLYNIAVASVHLYGLSRASVQVEVARKALEEALSQEPDRYVVLYGLSGLAALTGEEELAYNLLTEATQLSPYAFHNSMYDVAWATLRAQPRFLALLPAPSPEDEAKTNLRTVIKRRLDQVKSDS